MGRCEARRDTECRACSVLLCIEMYLLLLCPLAKGGEGTLGDEGRGPRNPLLLAPKVGGELDACGRATVPCFRGKRGGRVVLGRTRERDGQRGDEAGGEKMHLVETSCACT